MSESELTANIYRGVFSIVFTATCLTIFEILFFYFKIVPDINSQVEYYLQRIKSLFNNSSPLSDSVRSGIKSVIEVFAEKEHSNIIKLNRYTIYNCFFLLFVLSVIIFVLYLYLKNLNQEVGECAYYTGFATVFFLIIFQVGFYQLGKRYRYPGSKGDDELMYILIEDLYKKK